jgi:hypothetical protein
MHTAIRPLDMPEHRPPTCRELAKIRQWCSKREREARGHWSAMERMIRSSVANSIAKRNERRPKLSAAPTTGTP